MGLLKAVVTHIFAHHAPPSNVPVTQTNRAKIKVRFVYRWRLGPNPIRHRWEERLWGGDLLRLQMSELMKPHLPEHIELSFCPFYPRFWSFERWLRKQPRAIYILLYKVGYEFSPEQVQRLRDKAIAVGVDHKDGDLSKVDLSLFDFHISASESGRKALDQLLAERAPEAARRPFTDVLYQSPDTRLNGLPPRELDRLSTVYLGLRSNSSIPLKLPGRLM
jgi:hypothetical protein